MSFEDMPKRLERKTIYESDYVCLYADKVEMPDGYIIENYHQVHYPKDAVSIVVFNEKDEILIIRSKRYTTMLIEWEVPAGKIEPGEEPETAARGRNGTFAGSLGSLCRCETGGTDNG